MSGIENTLRQTLAKGDASDPEFRKRVYNAAANALRRSLQAQENMPPEAVQAQKDRLADAIRTVEMEYQAPPRPTDKFPRSPVDEAPNRPTMNRVQPVLRADAAEDRAKPAPENKKKSSWFRLDRGPLAAGLSTIALVGVLVLGLVWVMVSGAFQDPAARDTSVPNPPPDTGSESFEPRDPGTSTAPALRSEQESQGNWVTVFTADEITNLTLQGGATARAEADPFGNFILIETPGESSASVDLPLGPLQELLGSRAQVEITAKTSDGQTTQMAVECDLGPDINCVRTRFVVGQAAEAFIYRVDLSAVRTLQSGGRLILNSDLEGGGKDVKLISVRVRAEEQS